MEIEIETLKCQSLKRDRDRDFKNANPFIEIEIETMKMPIPLLRARSRLKKLKGITYYNTFDWKLSKQFKKYYKKSTFLESLAKGSGCQRISQATAIIWPWLWPPH